MNVPVAALANVKMQCSDMDYFLSSIKSTAARYPSEDIHIFGTIQHLHDGEFKPVFGKILTRFGFPTATAYDYQSMSACTFDEMGYTWEKINVDIPNYNGTVYCLMCTKDFSSMPDVHTTPDLHMIVPRDVNKKASNFSVEFAFTDPNGVETSKVWEEHDTDYKGFVDNIIASMPESSTQIKKVCFSCHGSRLNIRITFLTNYWPQISGRKVGIRKSFEPEESRHRPLFQIRRLGH